jgi:hypothetical protein
VLAEYEHRWAEAPRIARSMSHREAFDCLRVKEQETTTELSKHYNITRQDVRSIVPA